MAALTVTNASKTANSSISTQETVGIHSLPSELCDNIFKFLDYKSLANVSQTCVGLFLRIYNNRFSGSFFCSVIQKNMKLLHLQNELRDIRGVAVGDDNEFNPFYTRTGQLDVACKNLDAANKALEVVVADVMKKMSLDFQVSDPIELALLLSTLSTLAPELKYKLDAALEVQIEAQMSCERLQQRFVELLGASYGQLNGTVRCVQPEAGSAIARAMSAIANIEYDKVKGVDTKASDIIEMFNRHGNHLLPALLSRVATITPGYVEIRKEALERAVDVFNSSTSVFKK